MLDEQEKTLEFKPDDFLSGFVKRYKKNPVLFSKEVCRIKPGGWQIEFLRALAKDIETPRGAHIALASGHETGKTFISCVAMLWGITTRADCHIYCTSATTDQLKTRLWNYMQRIIAESTISTWFSVDTEKALFKHAPGNFIIRQAWSKDKPQSWAGEHCNSPWAIFDECSDIDQSIFAAWSGSASKAGAVTVLMGQPRIRHGALYDAFHKDKKYWLGMHVSSEDSPFTSKAFIEVSKFKYGEDSDYYRIRVKGLFPRADSSQMFPDAQEKRLEPSAAAERQSAVAGFDVAAGGGDYSVLFIRRGCEVVSCQKWDTPDHIALAPVVMEQIGLHGCTAMAVDINGIGYGIGQIIADMCKSKGIALIPVVGSKKARNIKKYHNKRAEAYGRLSESWNKLRFISGGVPSTELDILCKQLAAVRKFYDSDMRIQVLPKLELREELGGESPDAADALAYSFLAQSDYIDGGEPSKESQELRTKRSAEIRRTIANSNPYRS